MCRWCSALGLPRKRASRIALQRTSERVIALRESFASDTQPLLPSALGRLLCVDESHFDERCAQRRYARAPAGERAVLAQPYNGGSARGARITLLTAVGVMRDSRTGLLQTALALRLHTVGSCNRDVFTRFIRDKVVPLTVEMRAHNDALGLWQAPRTVVAPSLRAPVRQPLAQHATLAAPVAPAPAVSRRSGRIRIAPRRLDADFVYFDDKDDSSVAQPAARTKNNNKKKQHGQPQHSSTTTTTTFDRSRAIYALMDNWSGHRGDQVLDACGSALSRQFIPPYSPDFNLPIEGLFGDVKQWLRRHHYFGQPALTTEVIERAVRECATPSAVLARFKRAGYAVSDQLLSEARRQDGAGG